MKAHIFFVFLLVSYHSASAQFSIPYIHVEKAKPLDTGSVRRELTDDSNNRAEQLYQELSRRYQEQIVNVDMLPLRKQQFFNGANSLIIQQSNDIKEVPWAYCTENALVTIRFKKEMNSIFDATLIQSYKEEYRRVREWEIYLRDKNLLDSSYKNGVQSIGLTNREALSALYGVDKSLFERVNWK